jgi:hypothetical protein
MSLPGKGCLGWPRGDQRRGGEGGRRCGGRESGRAAPRSAPRMGRAVCAITTNANLKFLRGYYDDHTLARDVLTSVNFHANFRVG